MRALTYVLLAMFLVITASCSGGGSDLPTTADDAQPPKGPIIKLGML